MRLLTFSFVYLIGLTVVGSVFAWLMTSVIDYDYLKILSRSLLLLMALSLIPLWRLNGLTYESIGFRRVSLKWFAVGLTASIFMLLPLMLLFLVSGFRIWDPRVELVSINFLAEMLVIVIGAGLVSLFEETLFRGFLQRIVGDKLGLPSAIGLISILYATAHFLAPADMAVKEIGPFTGVLEIANAFAGVLSLVDELTSFATLVCIGIFLGFARERFGLWMAIALHMGWVIAIRTYKELTVRDVVNPFAEWTGAYDNFIGPLALFWLCFTFVLIRLWQRHQGNLHAS